MHVEISPRRMIGTDEWLGGQKKWLGGDDAPGGYGEKFDNEGRRRDMCALRQKEDGGLRRGSTPLCPSLDLMLTGRSSVRVRVESFIAGIRNGTRDWAPDLGKPMAVHRILL